MIDGPGVVPPLLRKPLFVDRDRLRTRGGQLERKFCPVSSSRRQIGPPPSPLSPSQARLREAWLRASGPGRALNLAADQAMIIALRRGAEQHKLRVVAYDGHVRTFALLEPPNSGPSLTRAPDRSDRRDEGSPAAPQRPRTSTHMLSFRLKASLFLEGGQLQLKKNEIEHRAIAGGRRRGRTRLAN